MEAETRTETRGATPETLEDALDCMAMKDVYIAKLEAQLKAVPFNPFVHLSTQEITSLAGSYPKQWRDSNALVMATAQTEFKCSEVESVFFAALKNDAEKIIDRDEVNSAVTFISNVLTGVAFPASTEVTLGLIQGKYEKLKINLRKTAGIRIRDYAYSKWQSETAKSIMDPVYKQLGVAEQEWMRK